MSAALDTIALDEQTLDGDISLPAGSTDDITFENFGLQNSEIITSILEEDIAARRAIRSSSVPGSDGELIERDQFPRKIIRMSGVVKSDTAALLDAKLDEIKKNLKAQNGTLKITKLGGEVRIYTATVQNFDRIFSRRRRITTVLFSIEFLCTEPFGLSESRVTTIFFGKTSASFNFEVENVGSYFADAIWIIGFDAAASATKVNITNNDTGEEIEVEPSGGFSAGDELIIDGENRTVKINGTDKDFAGQFWRLASGANDVTIAITSSSHSATITAKHFSTYL